MTPRPALGRSTDATALAAAPASSAAALSRDRVELPDLPVFRGPGWSLLSAVRWAVPLLVGGGFYSLVIYGQLSLLSLCAGLLVCGVSVCAAHLTLARRKRRLLAAGQRLAAYAERTRGLDDELAERARAATRVLESPWRPRDADDVNDAEQALHYARELLRTGS